MDRVLAEPRFRALTRNIEIKPAAVIAAAVRAQVDHANDVVLAEVRPYPPPKVPTTYERTNNLFRAWVVSGPRVTGSGVVTSIYNTMRYFKWVSGNEQQEQHEATGWKLLSESLHRDIYRKSLQAAINRVIGK